MNCVIGVMFSFFILFLDIKIINFVLLESGVDVFVVIVLLVLNIVCNLVNVFIVVLGCINLFWLKIFVCIFGFVFVYLIEFICIGIILLLNWLLCCVL